MTTDTTALQERMRSEIGYAVRTAAAHGYAKGKRGIDYGGTIDALIENAATAVMSVVAPAIQAAKAEALREAALQYGPGQLTGMFSRDGYARAWLQARATEYETGDQA